MTHEIAKKAAAKQAISFVKDGMRIGLGTGSTSQFFIEELIKKCREGLKVQATASSKRSEELAHQGGIPLLDLNSIHSLDLYFDGADEIDPEKRMIKGGGGALLREKILASMSHEMIVLVDESKLSSKLGHRPLPVEIVPFGYASTLHKLKLLGYSGKLRLNPDNTPFITDNHNFLYDIQLDPSKSRPEFDQQQIIAIPGVVETGFFFGLAGRIIIGYFDGTVVVQ